ncbi:hypothetical protein EDD90_5224 [Streptomyces sp. Ag109_O5-1]|nr:hypothetical protein EDD90_5224 [Streptomyces sp. Ag109_O5-1]
MALTAGTCTGNPTSATALGAASLLPSEPRTDTPRSARKSIAVGCRPARARVTSQGPRLRRRSRCPTRTNSRSPGPTVAPWAASAAARSSAVTCPPGSSQGTSRSRGTSRRTPRPTIPSRTRSRVSAPAPSGVTVLDGTPPYSSPSKITWQSASRWPSTSLWTFVANRARANARPGAAVSGWAGAVIRWEAGSGLSGPDRVSTVAASDTVRPDRTSATTATTRSGVSRFRAPRSSSPPPRGRPRSRRYRSRNAASVRGRGAVGREGTGWSEAIGTPPAPADCCGRLLPATAPAACFCRRFSRHRTTGKAGPPAGGGRIAPIGRRAEPCRALGTRPPGVRAPGVRPRLIRWNSRISRRSCRRSSPCRR